VLHSFVSKAMGIKLVHGRVTVIESEGFVLTLDFLLKLSNIHERVSCHIPCIMEGETGGFENSTGQNVLPPCQRFHSRNTASRNLREPGEACTRHRNHRRLVAAASSANGVFAAMVQVVQFLQDKVDKNRPIAVAGATEVAASHAT
jgi:hypothetical protein